MKQEKTNTKTEQETCSSTATTVSTTYARACIILLALNFCLTGYVMLNVVKMQEEAVSLDTQAPSEQVVKQTRTEPTAPTEVTDPVVPTVETLDKKE